MNTRTDAFPSILKKPKRREPDQNSRSFIDKSNKLREGDKKGVRRDKKDGKERPEKEPLPQGCSPLMYACQQGDYKALVEIIKNDERIAEDWRCCNLQPSTVTRRDRGLRCALHYCAEAGAGGAARVACADRLLMAAPAAAGARDADGLTPLHLAVIQGNVPLAQLLLAAGADVRAADNEHHTVVHWATVCGEVGALRAVLAAGADVATPDQHGGYPLHYAAQMCGAPATVDHQSRGTALEVLRALLREGGARADVRDSDGRSPLLWAASAGSAAAVLSLVKAGARVDDADRDGLTALHCAASRGHTECIETLLSLCGARTDAADSNGCTALHYAVTLGHADATALLLQHGADPHRQDRKGRSPAHCGAAKGQLETVRMLGARGANLWLRNSKGDLPLHEAVSSGRRELVKWLLDSRPSQVNATNHDGRTPLHVAASSDNADLCRVLLDRGADVNPVARSSRDEPLTPLDCATSRGYRTTAKYLQMHGGLPASKLTNAQIIIDDVSILSLPTRRVTSTKIDVQDRIRIEKREVVEMKSTRDRRNPYDSTDDSERSSGDEIYSSRRAKYRRNDQSIRRARRGRLEEPQRSFSDGHDSDFDRSPEKSKKVRSRSEPSKCRSSSHKGRQRHHSSSESDHHRMKKSKRHRKRSKRKSSTSCESSCSELSEQKNTKRTSKKTSIHIEEDEKKQTVNIINFKKSDNNRPSPHDELKPKSEDGHESENNKIVLSETETDTVSLKNSTVVTEAQVHVAQEPVAANDTDITVTLDSSNVVSVETPTLKITQQMKKVESKELVDGKQEEKPSIENIGENTNEKKIKESEVNSKEKQKNDNENNNTNENNKENVNAREKDKNNVPKVDLQNNQSLAKEFIEKELEVVSQTETTIKHDTDVKHDTDLLITKEREDDTVVQTSQKIENDDNGNNRKRSFEIISTPEEIEKISNALNETTHQNQEITQASSSVSFANASKGEHEHLMGDKNIIDHETMPASAESMIKIKDDSNEGRRLSVSRKEYASTTQSSGDIVSTDGLVNEAPGLMSIIDSNATDTDRDRGMKQVIMGSSQDETPIRASPKSSRKASKDSRSSRKSSLYETESYKVLSDVNSATDAKTGILKKSRENINEIGTGFEKSTKNPSYGRVGSVSDNEMYGGSEANGRRKKFRKKIRDKSRSAIRSKSENSERGYESSGLMDSGFEPSPRMVHQTNIMSPRLSAYYRQRNASGKYSGKLDSRIPIRKPGDKHAVDMRSVTQRIQTNMRRYYCERKIFQHLLELKRLQIRSSKTNEAVFVKRAIDDYNNSNLSTVGIGPYNSPDYTFSSFEKFLYESLRKLQKSGKKHLDRLPEKPIDFDYGESELYKMGSIPDNPCLCTNKTHRCFHAVHAYTGIPCSAYIPQKLNHHTMPKPGVSKGFLPKIDSRSKPHVTLEVSHGTERQLISLPSEKLEKNKRYYVTFTVKGSNPTSDNDTKADENTQKNAKSV